MAFPLLAPAPEGPLDPGPRPSFSVVIPAYEVAEYVAEAVRSALDQTLAPVEVIVVDDGSPDDVAGALAPYRDRIVLIRQENQGPGAAKLNGARAASGDFVSFLDGDDFYLPERLATLAEAAVRRPDLAILGTNAWIDLGGKRLRQVYDETWTFAVADQRREILRRCFLLGHAAARRELLVALPEADRNALDDWECWARLILGGARAGLVDLPLSCYRVRPGSISTNRTSLYRRGVATMALLRSDPTLTPGERATLAGTEAEWRRLFAIEAARDALRAGDGRARRLLLKVAGDRRQGWRPRAKAVVSMLAPGRARKLLLERDRTFWIGPGGLHVARDEPPG